MEIIISAIHILIILKILNLLFDYKQRIRAYFDSTIGYRIFNTFVYLLLMAPMMVMLGHYFFNSSLFTTSFIGLMYTNYCPQKSKK